MDKKKLKEKRKRGYFIEAAKEIILTEGIESLSVKRIADDAGFSPGTLYNYFKDLNTLLFHCILSFFDDCKEEVLERIDDELSAKEKSINLALYYSEYYIENPNVYKLIFFMDLGEIPRESGYTPEIIKISKDTLLNYMKETNKDEETTDIVVGIISNIIHGNLMFYIKGRSPIDKKDLLKKIENEVRFVLEK